VNPVGNVAIGRQVFPKFIFKRLALVTFTILDEIAEKVVI
jgi:hypothetical protein